MSLQNVTIDDVHTAEGVIRQHLTPAPLVRSYALEKELSLAEWAASLAEGLWLDAGRFV
ncbi:MAG: hypothetical protein ACJ0UT_09870 [Candidatus Latescibacterota bacterium]